MVRVRDEMVMVMIMIIIMMKTTCFSVQFCFAWFTWNVEATLTFHHTFLGWSLCCPAALLPNAQQKQTTSRKEFAFALSHLYLRVLKMQLIEKKATQHDLFTLSSFLFLIRNFSRYVSVTTTTTTTKLPIPTPTQARATFRWCLLLLLFPKVLSI